MPLQFTDDDLKKLRNELLTLLDDDDAKTKLAALKLLLDMLENADKAAVNSNTVENARSLWLQKRLKYSKKYMS